jgi:hypothetical protein
MATSNVRNGSPGGSIAVRERERVAVQLRIDGLTYDEIGARLGVSRRMASRIVNRAMNRVLREPVGQLVDLESARLDALWQAMWPRALAGSAATPRCACASASAGPGYSAWTSRPSWRCACRARRSTPSTARSSSCWRATDAARAAREPPPWPGPGSDVVASSSAAAPGGGVIARAPAGRPSKTGAWGRVRGRLGHRFAPLGWVLVDVPRGQYRRWPRQRAPAGTRW